METTEELSAPKLLFTCLPDICESYIEFHHCQNMAFFFLYNVNSDECVIIFHFASHEIIFSYAFLVIWTYNLCNAYLSLLSNFIDLFTFFLLIYTSAFSSLDRNLLLHKCALKILFPVCCLPFHFLHIGYRLPEIFNSGDIYIYIFSFMHIVFWVFPEKSSLTPRSWRNTLFFPHRSLSF